MSANLWRCSASVRRSLLAVSQGVSTHAHHVRSHSTALGKQQLANPYPQIINTHLFRYYSTTQNDAGSSPRARITQFQELADQKLVDPSVINTITRKMGLQTMTDVQSLTINEALKGVDVLAQAKTGTGKTIGFLLPLLQNILREDPRLLDPRQRRGTFDERRSDIRAIVISPTRELAEQIAVEAKRLVSNTGVIIQTAVGGTQKSMHLNAMRREGCHILVGTPGRLKDILSTEVEAPKLTALVLDEADRLMDQGFWPEIQDIQSLLPSIEEKNRQTMMFSATIPKDVVHLVRQVMKPGLHYVKTVNENEAPTHEKVKQKMVVVPGFENQLAAVYELCEREVIKSNEPGSNTRPFKAIVYFNATAETELASQLFLELRMKGSAALRTTRIFELHSKLSQNRRTSAANYFREAKSAILMSSDVSARGMDFPDVTHVIQVGIPQTQDTYIHRIGRTARAGKEGEGWIILPQKALQEARSRLKGIPVEMDESLETRSANFAETDGEEPQDLAPRVQKIFGDLRVSAQYMPQEMFRNAYRAYFGTMQYISDKHWLVDSINRLAKVQWGLTQPPSISSGLIAKLGLSRIPGIRQTSFAAAREMGNRYGSGDDLRYDSRRTRSRRNSFGSGEGKSYGGFGSGERERGGDRGSGGYGERRSRY